jgi:hypothetical protein
MKVWYAIGAVIIIALALWYFLVRGGSPGADIQPVATEPIQLAPLSSGDTTEDILSDLNQALEETDALNADAAASAQAVQGL